MSLVVGISRGDAYALVTSDSITFQQSPDGQEWQATTLKAPPKGVALTRCVLLATTGDVFLTAEFAEGIRSRVQPDDDLTACREAAVETVAELLEAERPSGPRFHEGALIPAASIRDYASLSFILTGFLVAGGSGIVTYCSGKAEGVTEICSDPELGQIAASVPYGVRDEDVRQFYALSAQELEENLSLAGAFRRAFSVHRFLGTSYTDRVSDDVNVVVLLRSSAPEEAKVATFALDWRDTDTASDIYAALAGLNVAG